MKKFIVTTALLFVCQFSLAQAIYGVFTPTPNVGEKQIGTVNPSTGDITLLGSNSAVESGSLAMTTGATALNVTDSYSYFIGRDSLNVDKIFTIDLTSGGNIVGSPQTLAAGYTTSNNFGIWYDDVDDTLYALFLTGGTDAELVSINPTSGAVTTIMADITNGEGVDTLASGLLTGDQDNDRLFAFINDSIWTIYPDAVESWMTEVGNASFLSNKTFGLEWDSVSNALWVLYNPDLGDRQLAKVISEEWTDEAEKELDIFLDGGANIATASGLSAVDEASGLYFFIGRPSVGANASKWSLYTIDLANETNTSVDIEDTMVVATNNYAGIEVLPGPDLTFSKSDGGELLTEPGDTITYTLNYSNDNNAGATNGLIITETVPAETTFLPGSSSPAWICTPNNLAGSSCVISPADIAPGGSGSVSFVVQVNDMVSVGVSQISNTATIDANNMVNSMMASDTTPITAAPTLTVTKTDNDLLDAEPGDTIAYDISVNNTGDMVASNVILTETVPANTNYVPMAPFVWSCLPDNSAGSTCTTPAVDLADTSLDSTFHVQVISSVPAGTTEISNDVTVSADNAASDQASDTTPITSAATLSVSKTDNDATFIPGETVVYKIDYGNTGNQDADTTTLSEVVLAETVFNAAASSPGWDCPMGITEGNTCTFDIGTLGGGDSGSVDFALTLNTPVPGIFSQVENNVVIDATNASAMVAQDTTPVDAEVDLRIVKTDGEVTAALGKVINYTLISFNDGDRNALNVQLTETVPDNTTFYPPSSSPGWICTPDSEPGSTCTFDVGSLDGLGGKSSIFFAVKVDETLDPGVTELSNTASISAFNSLDTDQDTEFTPVDQVIPSVTLIDANPSITEIVSCSQNDAAIAEIIVSFSDDNPNLIGTSELMNFALIDTGADQDLQTLSCDTALGDDSKVSIDNINSGGTATMPNTTLTLDNPISNGQYVLMTCDDITDAAGNAIDGDADGLPGGNLLRQFRIDTDNLFSNAYLDDCYDNPISLTNWGEVGTTVDDTITAITSIDYDDSSLSGSMEYHSPNGAEMGVSQCTNINDYGSHTISASTIGIPSQEFDTFMYLNCEFYDGLDCSGNVLQPTHIETVRLEPSTSPVWTNHESIMLLPENTASAGCFFVLTNIGIPYTFYLDELSLNYSDLIFEDGFEAD